MKSLNRILIGFCTLLLGWGCAQDPDYENYVYPPAYDRASLNALIDECKALVKNSEVGTGQGQYLDFVMSNFEKAINESSKVLGNDKATQQMIEVAAEKLTKSKDVFLSSVNTGPVDPNDSSLSLHLRFAGNTLDSSPYGHTLLLNEGNQLCGNGPRPQLTTDRNGVENAAIHFQKGGYISIPNVDGKSEALNPEVMTFMCWIKEENPAPIQRWLFCLNTWNIFYVIMPAGGNEVQFSGQSTRGWLPLYNSGINTSGKWMHLAITYAPEGVCFYKNGELISRQDGMGNLVRNDAKIPFLIGLMDPTRELYFEGDMDEIRLYNKVLNAEEVASVFAIEKPASMETDKSQLQSRIEEANQAKAQAQVGFTTGKYLPRTIEAFQSEIDEAAAVNDNAKATQNQVDRAESALAAAITRFADAANNRDFDPNLTLSLAFDGNFNDDSHAAHKATLIKGSNDLPPYPAIDRYGNYDGACHFDKGSYISIPFDETLNPSSLTYMCWVKAANPAGAGDPYLMSIGRRFGFYLGLSGGSLVYGGVAAQGTVAEINSGATVSANWEHIALTYSADGIKFYKNGVLVKTDTAKGNLVKLTEDQPFVIGVKGTSDNTSSYFRGDLDEVRVYDRALSDSEIATVYNTQKP